MELTPWKVTVMLVKEHGVLKVREGSSRWARSQMGCLHESWQPLGVHLLNHARRASQLTADVMPPLAPDRGCSLASGPRCSGR